MIPCRRRSRPRRDGREWRRVAGWRRFATRCELRTQLARRVKPQGVIVTIHVALRHVTITAMTAPSTSDPQMVRPAAGAPQSTPIRSYHAAKHFINWRRTAEQIHLARLVFPERRANSRSRSTGRRDVGDQSLRFLPRTGSREVSVRVRRLAEHGELAPFASGCRPALFERYLARIPRVPPDRAVSGGASTSSCRPTCVT